MRSVASRLAQAEGQETLSIVDCIRDGRYAFEDEVIGIVSPTYFWGLPSIVGEFLGKASFKTGYLFFIATYGTTPALPESWRPRPYAGGKSTRTTLCAWQTHGRLFSTSRRAKRRRDSPARRKQVSTARYAA